MSSQLQKSTNPKVETKTEIAKPSFVEISSSSSSSSFSADEHHLSPTSADRKSDQTSEDTFASKATSISKSSKLSPTKMSSTLPVSSPPAADDQHPEAIFFEFMRLNATSQEQFSFIQQQQHLQQQLMASLERPPQVVKEGWLNKRGEHIRNWRPRYFVLLDNGSLLGFKKQPPLAGPEPSTPTRFEDPLNDFALHEALIMKTDHPKTNVFILRGRLQWHSETVVERMFHVPNRTDRDDWFNVISRTISCLPKFEDLARMLPFLEEKGQVDEEDVKIETDAEKKEIKSNKSEEGKAPSRNLLQLNPFFGRPTSSKGRNKFLEARVRSRLRATQNGSKNEAQNGSPPVVSPTSAAKRTKGLADFEFLKQIGRGSFGKVVLCRERQTGFFYALKMLKKTTIIEKDEVAHTLTENRVLQHTKHPFLIELKYSFQTDTLLCFVMEYVNGGELFFHLSRERLFSQRRTHFYGCQIVLALEYLHSKGIIYRDLKLENILLDKEGNIKIADFGLCKEHIVFGATTKTFCGTPEYLAPEILEDADYGRAVDWWGLGVVLYEMLTGRLPFNERDHDMLFEKILVEEAVIPKNLTLEAASLLEGLLRKNPQLRLGGGADDAREIMGQPFFRGVNWEDVFEKRIPPPFTPQVESETDVRYFDTIFTGEKLVQLETPPESKGQSKLANSGSFGFLGKDSIASNPIKTIPPFACEDTMCDVNEQPYFTQFSYNGSIDGSSSSEMSPRGQLPDW